MTLTGMTINTGNMEELRVRIGEWAHKNFGEGKDSSRRVMHCALGIAEELGELQEGIETADSEVSEEFIFDAIGDIGVYMLDMMFKLEATASAVLLRVKEPDRAEANYLKDLAGHFLFCRLV